MLGFGKEQIVAAERRQAYCIGFCSSRLQSKQLFGSTGLSAEEGHIEDAPTAPVSYISERRRLSKLFLASY
ncbi:hypothetical protein HYQ45_001146 [Verticillium longisporum]|uniref:Uncharacterized protein n=1 Tax=Verticillium longisporum TaxID=100787 RepID=A0A8I3A279_VERLO|nr:hypothetical protein HYQ45_001146 [Verticillium longisporum]